MEEISRSERRAGKPHKCFDCYRTIPKGEVHDVFVGKEDTIYTLRSHLDCRDAAYEYISDGYSPDYEDGVPPLYDMVQDSGEFELECNRLRGYYPHVVCRFELNEQLEEIRWQEKIAARACAEKEGE